MKEHLARLRGSWRNENCQQSRAANEVSTGVDRQWLTLRQAEERATDRRNQQLLREHHSYQQQLVRELAHGSSHQQRYYPPALAPRPSLTPAPLIMRAATRMGPPKRSAPPPPYQAPGEPLRKRPCLSTPSSWPCREQWELLVELGRRQAGSQLEQRNAVRQLNQMWQADPLAVGESLAQLVRTPVGLFLPPAAPPAELVVLPNGTTIPCFPRMYMDTRSTPAASAPPAELVVLPNGTTIPCFPSVSSPASVQHGGAKSMVATDHVKDATFLCFLSGTLIVGSRIGPGIARKLSAGTGLQTCGELADAKLEAVAKMVVKGWPHVAELRDALRRADVALFPNRCEGGNNLVAMESIASGVPVILSANTGHLDIIAEIGSDVLFPLVRQGRVPPASLAVHCLSAPGSIGGGSANAGK